MIIEHTTVHTCRVTNNIECLCVESYNGEWKDGMMHGVGVFRYRNGTTYEGEWRMDKRVTI